MRPGERVLIITDDLEIGEMLAKNTEELNGELIYVYLHPSQRPQEKLPAPLRSAIVRSDIVLTTLTQRLPEEADFRRGIIDAVHQEGGARLAHMPGIKKDTFFECMAKTDCQETKGLGEKLARILTLGRTLKIISTDDSVLEVEIGRWDNVADADTLITTRRSWANLPLGESFVLPRIGTAKGRIIINGGYPGKILREGDEITLDVKNGRISITGDNAASKELANYLQNLDAKAEPEDRGNMYLVSEIGLGTNRFARQVPQMVEYEKKLGTLHIAVGLNTFLGGNISAPEHHDMVVENGTMEVDGKIVLEDGQLYLDNFGEELQPNYRDFPRGLITPETEVKRTEVAGIAKSEQGILYRIWIGRATRNEFRVLVGDLETAQKAAEVWEIIVAQRKMPVRDLAQQIEISCDNMIRVVNLMIDYQILALHETG